MTPGFNANEVTNKIVTPQLPRNQFVQKIGGAVWVDPSRRIRLSFLVASNSYAPCRPLKSPDTSTLRKRAKGCFDI